MPLKPTGNRVIVIPAAAQTESAGGIAFPDNARSDPAMSGTVVSVARGPASAHRVRQYTIAHCMHLLSEVAERVPSAALRGELEDEFARYAMADVQLSEVKEGDHVAFAYTAGQHMSVDGETYIVLTEDDIVATWTPEKEAAA